MKKLLSSLLIFVMMLSLSSCASTKLPEGFDKDEVTEHAKEIVDLINAKDYESLNAEMRDDLKDALTIDKLKEAFDAPISEAGAFVEVKQVVTATGPKSQNNGEDFVYAVVVCKYEKVNHTYTLSFDRDMKLIGLYIK
jgi:hypothetical protein